MCQSQSLGEILIKLQRARQRTRNLGDLNRMGQAGTIMIALVGHKNLCLMSEAPEGGRMDDPVTVALKFGPGWRDWLGEKPPTRAPGIGGKRRAQHTVSGRAQGIQRLTR
jgi:hypothetical protein